MELKSFEQLLRRHDWYYPAAEGNAFWEGKKSEDNIRAALQTMWLDDPFEAEKAHKLFKEYVASSRMTI